MLRLTDNGISVTLQGIFNCTNPAPGCVSFYGIRGTAIAALIDAFGGNVCGESLTVVEGTEPGHSTSFGVLSTELGNMIAILDTPCVRAVAVLGTRVVLSGVSRPCEEIYSHGNSWWCLSNSTPTARWVIMCQSWVGVDTTREAYRCGDQETLIACAAVVQDLQVYPTPASAPVAAFAEDYGFLLRLGRVCPCNVAGGAFLVNQTMFAAVRAYVALPANVNLQLAVSRLLNNVVLATLPYGALRSCLVSALFARLYIHMHVVIPDLLASQQSTVFAPLFASSSCTGANFTTTGYVANATCRARIGLVLDESGSIGLSNYQLAKAGLQQFAINPTLSPTSLISLVTFSTIARLRFNWTAPVVAGGLIANLPYPGGSTYTHLGMNMSLGLFPPANPAGDEEKLLMVVATDGRSTNYASMVQQIGWIPSRITLFSLGIGAGIVQSELNELARCASNAPVCANKRSLTSFAAFATYVNGVLQEMCQTHDPIIPQANCSLWTGLSGSGASPTCTSFTNMAPSQQRSFTLPVDASSQIELRATKGTGSGCVTFYVSSTVRNSSSRAHTAKLTTCGVSGAGTLVFNPRAGRFLDLRKAREAYFLRTGLWRSAHHFAPQAATGASEVYVTVEASGASTASATLGFQSVPAPQTAPAPTAKAASPAPPQSQAQASQPVDAPVAGASPPTATGAQQVPQAAVVASATAPPGGVSGSQGTSASGASDASRGPAAAGTSSAGDGSATPGAPGADAGSLRNTAQSHAARVEASVAPFAILVLCLIVV